MSDLVPFGLELEGVVDVGDRKSLESVPAQFRHMVVIALLRDDLPFDPTLEWLTSRLPAGAARQQLVNAAVVILTEPGARAAKVLRYEAEINEPLIMHTSAIG